MARNHDRTAWAYETAADIFSTGQIAASKRDQIQEIKPGDRVLLLGVGAGEDAVMAAEAGAIVTCVDISRGMLDKLQRKLDQEKLTAELICDSALHHDRAGHYDICCANYFLNVFRRGMMSDMLNHAATRVRAGGKLMIADVAMPQGNPVAKALGWLHLRSAMAGCVALGMLKWHEIYDYPANFDDAGLKLQRVRHFRLGRIGPVAYQNIVATRKQ